MLLSEYWQSYFKCSFPWTYSSCSWLSFLKPIIIFRKFRKISLIFSASFSLSSLFINFTLSQVFNRLSPFLFQHLQSDIFLLTFTVCENKLIWWNVYYSYYTCLCNNSICFFLKNSFHFSLYLCYLSFIKIISYLVLNTFYLNSLGILVGVSYI